MIAGGVDFSAFGEVKNSVFSDQPQKTLREFDDDDNECEINRMVYNIYNNNRFFTQPVGEDGFQNNLTGNTKNVDELNDLVVVRTHCANTNKSTIDNVVLSGEPSLGALLAVPPRILPMNAAGDPPPPTEAFLAYAWGGSSATLDGTPLTDGTGLQGTTTGQHTLVVGSTSVVDHVANGATPNAVFTPSPQFISAGESSDLNWLTTAGTFICLSIDRTVEVSPEAATGSETMMPEATTSYNLHLLTEEGGSYRQGTVFVDEVIQGLIFSDGFESGGFGSWSSVGP